MNRSYPLLARDLAAVIIGRAATAQRDEQLEVLAHGLNDLIENAYGSPNA